jgi:nucleoside-diphosphate-sugar epimerase
VLDGKPMPEPPAERSAGPIRPGRGSMLQDKVAVVTGAARGIGRAIAVEMAANGADVIAVDIAGKVSPASNAVIQRNRDKIQRNRDKISTRKSDGGVFTQAGPKPDWEKAHQRARR